MNIIAERDNLGTCDKYCEILAIFKYFLLHYFLEIENHLQ